MLVPISRYQIWGEIHSEVFGYCISRLFQAMDCYGALCFILAVTLTVAAIDGPCSAEDPPVCGQDDQTYKNKCKAEMAYVTSKSLNF